MNLTQETNQIFKRSKEQINQVKSPADLNEMIKAFHNQAIVLFLKTRFRPAEQTAKKYMDIILTEIERRFKHKENEDTKNIIDTVCKTAYRTAIREALDVATNPDKTSEDIRDRLLEMLLDEGRTDWDRIQEINKKY